MNITNGPITYTNRALKRVSGDASYIFYQTNLVVPFLPPGTNVLAVELHINSPVVPSVGFDLELLGIGYPISTPSLSVNLSASGIALSWPCADGLGYSLFSSTNLNAAVAWQPEPTSAR